MKNRFRKIPAGAAVLVTLAASSVVCRTAYADDAASLSPPNLSLQQAEQIGVNMFQISSNYTLQNESYNSNPDGMDPPTYSFTYAQSDPTEMPTWVSVTVDANSGRIINYNQPAKDTHFQFPVPKTPDDAKNIAIGWAQKLYPDQYQQTTILPQRAQFGSLSGPVSYSFNFERVVGGIPAPFDGFSITINQDGQLTSVFDHWTDATFPSSTTQLSKETAVDVYKSALDLHLVYRPVWHSDAKANTELLYTQVPPSNAYWNTMFGDQASIGTPVINAQTGGVIDSAGLALKPSPYQQPQPLVPGGPTLPASLPNVNWDEEKSLKYAVQLIGISAGDNLTMVNQNQSNGNVIWNFTWKTTDNRQVNVSVNATYGLLTNYSTYGFGPMKTASGQPSGSSTAGTVTQDQIDKTVQTFAKKLFPNATGSFALFPVPTGAANGALQTSFQVEQLVNGVPNEANEGNINVDPLTGAIQDMWFNLQPQDDTLPVPSAAISMDDAKQNWVATHSLSLEYLMTQPTGDTRVSNGKEPAQPRQDAKIVLAYAPVGASGSSDTFNAVTGQFESPDIQMAYTGAIHDLGDSSAAAELQLLVNRELIAVDENGNIHPEQNVTNAGFVKLIVDGLGQQYRYNPKLRMDSATSAALSSVPKDAPAYPEIATAYQLGWLPQGQPFKPNDLITRGAAAQIIAEALGYGPLLNVPDAFQSTAHDAANISRSEFAADAITSALGIFPLQDEDFNSSHHVTLSDAAIAVVQTANICSRTSPIVYAGGK